MTETSSAGLTAVRLVQERFPQWSSRDDNIAKLQALSPRQSEALTNLLESELAAEPTYMLRAKRIDDLRQFDFALNQLAGSLIMDLDAQRARANSVTTPSYDLGRSLFASAVSEQSVQRIVETLQRDGYGPSPVALTREQLDKVFSALRKREFATKGPEPKQISGADLLNRVSQSGSPGLENGDTFWLTDQDALVHDDFLFRLAFDPFIVGVATGYFGCAPVHAQTNAWFSFPSMRSRNNLSSNAQMFHQDKEFVKFLKVFIYLTDVNEDSGPHQYVEGSHRDELHRKGQDISERVSDADITKYYDASRIKTVTGPAGLIMFGDTSSVHKGSPVRSGYRAMLQFEYTTSLYLSPAQPFSDMTAAESASLPFEDVGHQRLMANYNSAERAAFAAAASAEATAAPPRSPLRVFASKIKRRLESIVAR